MILGLNLAHGSSAALISSNGQIICALEEERLSRVKNHIGFPLDAMRAVLSKPDFPIDSISDLVIGNTNNYTLGEAKVAIASLEGNPSNKSGMGMPLRPGFELTGFKGKSGTEVIEEFVMKTLQDLDISTNFQTTWVKHHDSHLGCSLGACTNAKTLLFSLDGAGDGESGAIAISKDRKMSRLASISQLDSLGSLYEAVTRKYNFTPGKHEGKITGLASFGKHSQAVDVLLKFVEVENGKLKINYAKNKWKTEFTFLLRKLNIPNELKLSVKEIIDAASENTSEYADLAFAVQEVLEKSVLEIARFWLDKTGTDRLSVSGGVFANVKLNQRLAENLNIKELSIFPNMGDAGLSVGGVWAHLAKQDSLDSGLLYKSMLLAPNNDKVNLDIPSEVEFIRYDNISLAKIAAKMISQGKFVAIHLGEMEFGPRALGSRSLLLDPRDRSILSSANFRLRRTEFMPFAPVILEPHFDVYFEPLKPSLSYSDMTITCNVVAEKRSLIPAVTHVDGTARPQSVPENQTMYSLVIQEFYKMTGIPLLVNTSFNVHEEPINYKLEDSVSCLLRGAVDYVVVENGMLSLKSNQTIQS